MELMERACITGFGMHHSALRPRDVQRDMRQVEPESMNGDTVTATVTTVTICMRGDAIVMSSAFA